MPCPPAPVSLQSLRIPLPLVTPCGIQAGLIHARGQTQVVQRGRRHPCRQNRAVACSSANAGSYALGRPRGLDSIFVPFRQNKLTRNIFLLYSTQIISRSPFMHLAHQILTALVALLHIYFLVLEMFLWTRPTGRRAFGLTAEFAQSTARLAANQGFTTASWRRACFGAWPGATQARPSAPFPGLRGGGWGVWRRHGASQNSVRSKACQPPWPWRCRWPLAQWVRK